MNFWNKFGLFTKEEVEEVKKQYEKVIVNLQDKNSTLLYTEDVLRKDINEMPFRFDILLKKYNENQLNSLFYKLINFCRNDKKLDHLIERWDCRLQNANETLVKK